MSRTIQYLCDPDAQLRHWGVVGYPVEGWQGGGYPAYGDVTAFTPEEALSRVMAQARAEGQPVATYRWDVTELDGPPVETDAERAEPFLRGLAEGQEHGLVLAQHGHRPTPLDRIARHAIMEAEDLTQCPLCMEHHPQGPNGWDERACEVHLSL